MYRYQYIIILIRINQIILSIFLNLRITNIKFAQYILYYCINFYSYVHYYNTFKNISNGMNEERLQVDIDTNLTTTTTFLPLNNINDFSLVNF